MHRRAARTLVTVLLSALVGLLPATVSTAAHPFPSLTRSSPAVAASSVAAAASTTTVPDGSTTTLPERSLPPIADNEFLPENANLSDCVGFVERPGCGSEARGGLQQTLIFMALTVGLAIIFWRVSVGVRRNRQNTSPPASPNA